MFVDDYYGYGFNDHSGTGSMEPNQFEKSNGMMTIIWFTQNSTEIRIKYPKEIGLASVTVAGIEREFNLSNYYGEYKSSTSRDIFKLQSNNNKKLSVVVKVM